MSGSVEHAKHELLNYARRHDAERAERRRPVRAMLITAGVAVLAVRLISKIRRAPGGGLMGGLLALRLAAKYGPMLAEGIKQARKACASPASHNGKARAATRPDRLPVASVVSTQEAPPEPVGAP